MKVYKWVPTADQADASLPKPVKEAPTDSVENSQEPFEAQGKTGENAPTDFSTLNTNGPEDSNAAFDSEAAFDSDSNQAYAFGGTGVNDDSNTDFSAMHEPPADTIDSLDAPVKHL
jgi:hypothetical protein